MSQLRANRRLGWPAEPVLDESLGLKDMTSRAFQVRHVTRLSENLLNREGATRCSGCLRGQDLQYTPHSSILLKFRAPFASLGGGTLKLTGAGVLWLGRAHAAGARISAEKQAEHQASDAHCAGDLESLRTQTAAGRFGTKRGSAGCRFVTCCLLSLMHGGGLRWVILRRCLSQSFALRDVHVVLVG